VAASLLIALVAAGAAGRWFWQSSRHQPELAAGTAAQHSSNRDLEWQHLLLPHARSGSSGSGTPSAAATSAAGKRSGGLHAGVLHTWGVTRRDRLEGLLNSEITSRAAGGPTSSSGSGSRGKPGGALEMRPMAALPEDLAHQLPA